MIEDEETEGSESNKKIQESIDGLMKKINDFNLLASTLNSKAPARDAYKMVFGIDRPDLDPNTPEGMRKKNEMNSYIGKSNE